MTERGHPTEGAPACPFVAFEDDRDGRATVPDHRHRCFAEPRPAPRALAHQEAYCLSSAFPVCPTFQDWARREAAAARAQPAAPAQPREEPPESRPMPPLEREPLHAPTSAPAAAIPPRRNPPRDWASPPPWTGEAGAVGDPAAAAAAAAALAAAGRAADPYDPYAAPPDDVPKPASSREPADAWDSASRGLAGSAAYRLAGPDPDDPYGVASQDPYASPSSTDEPDTWSPAGPAVAAASSTAWAAPSQGGGAAPSRRGAPQGQGRGTQPPGRQGSAGSRPPAAHPDDGQSGAHRQEPSELFGPAWERPRRYEAYPTLRTRMGLPSFSGIPRLGMAALALILAAMFLFFFGPMILGFGQNDPGGVGAGATATPTAEATATPAPTEPPAPTPQVYVVVRGDTMSRIAKKVGLTIEEILAANPQIKNPDRIQVGDKITIPLPVEDDGTVEESTEP